MVEISRPSKLSENRKEVSAVNPKYFHEKCPINFIQSALEPLVDQLQNALSTIFIQHVKKNYRGFWLGGTLNITHHDLCIFGTCCNYCLCSLDLEESIGNNYSITRPTKTILTQEKDDCSVLSKSNIDEAQIQVEISVKPQIWPRNFFKIV